MIVFRLEGLDGIGPYRTEQTEEMLLAMDIQHEFSESRGYRNQPSPFEDRVVAPEQHLDRTLWRAVHTNGKTIGEYRFGFKSLHHLKRWFASESLEWMHEAGVVCQCYKVDENQVIRTSRQLAFEKKGARLKGSISLLDVLDGPIPYNESAWDD